MANNCLCFYNRVIPKSIIWRRADWFSTFVVIWKKKTHVDLQMKRWEESSHLISLSAIGHEPFYNSPQMYWTSQPSSTELILARPYCRNAHLFHGHDFFWVEFCLRNMWMFSISWMKTSVLGSRISSWDFFAKSNKYCGFQWFGIKFQWFET